jgi:hypothetical protein
MCEAPAAAAMKVGVKGRNYETDRCAEHLAEEMALMRPTKRGRKKATLA